MAVSHNNCTLFAEFNTDGRWWSLRLFVAAADGKWGTRTIQAPESGLLTKIVTVTECLGHYARVVKRPEEAAQLDRLSRLAEQCQLRLSKAAVLPWSQLWDRSKPLCPVPISRNSKLSIKDLSFHLAPRLQNLLDLLHTSEADVKSPRGLWSKQSSQNVFSPGPAQFQARQPHSAAEAAANEAAGDYTFALLTAVWRRYQQCRQCGEDCTEPHADATLYCSLCIQPVHACCRQPWHENSHSDDTVDDFPRRIWCCTQCKSISTNMQALIDQTVTEGCIRLLLPFPPNLGITVTAGPNDSQPSQTRTILPAARKLLHAFSDAYRELNLPDSPRVNLIGAFVQCSHPLWYWNNAYTIVLWDGVPAEGPINLKNCTAVNTVIVRIQGEAVADLLYTATASRFQNCKLLTIAMLCLQLLFVKLGVQNVFLDAANETAHNVWTAPSLGFQAISESYFDALKLQWSLVHNTGVFSRLLKAVPDERSLLQQMEELSAVVQHRLQIKRFEAFCQAKEKRKAESEGPSSPKRCRRVREQINV